MWRLLSIEFHKLKHSTSTKVYSIIYLALIIILCLIPIIEVDLSENVGGKLAEIGFFNFPYIWHFITYVVSYLKIFIIIVIISLVSSEYSNRTIKQNLIDGLSKKELLLSKIYMVIAYALVITFLVFVITLILGYSYSDYTEASIVFTDLEYLLGFFLNHMLFFSFCLFAAMLVKRSAFALGFVFIWFVAENILYWSVYWQLDQPMGYEITEYLQYILPLETSSSLLVEPASRNELINEGVSRALQEDYQKEYGVGIGHIFTSVIWIILFNFFSYRILKSRDL